MPAGRPAGMRAIVAARPRASASMAQPCSYVNRIGANSALKNSASAARLGLEADDEHRGFGAGSDGEDDERGAVGGREEEQVRRDAGHELPRGAGADQEAHD